MSGHATATVQARKRPAATTLAEPASGVPFEGNRQAFFEGSRQAFERWFRGMLELSQEMLQFTQARLQEDAAAWVRLASLRSPEEALQFQQSFTERMAKEYLEEINRLSKIVGGMTCGSIAPPQHAPHAES